MLTNNTFYLIFLLISYCTLGIFTSVTILQKSRFFSNCFLFDTKNYGSEFVFRIQKNLLLRILHSDSNILPFRKKGSTTLVHRQRITNLFHFYCSFRKYLKLCWCDRKTKGKSLRNCVHNTDLELQYNALKAAFRQCTQAI